MNQGAYETREGRLDAAIALRKPDRVPVAPLIVHYYATRAAGISNGEAMLDYERAWQAAKACTLEYDFDVAVVPTALFPARIMEHMGLTNFKWPGGSLPDTEPFQFHGAERMKAGQYDEFLADPSGFTARNLWPQMSTTLGALGELPFPPAYWASSDYDLIYMVPSMVGAPRTLEALKRLVAAGEEYQRWAAIAGKATAEMVELGYPSPFGGTTFTAFDWIGDFFRDMRGVLTDMFRDPGRLLAAIELLTPATIQKGIASALAVQSKRVFIPLHWGSGGFMSNEQYARFYWPSLKVLLLKLIEADLTPIPLFEGNYTDRLEFLRELPKGKVAAHFDVVDRKKAKAVIGDTMCFWGNVPASLLVTGTPADVKDNVRELIEIFGDNGGLILDANLGLPDEARPENVAAMVEAAAEFGVY